MTDFSVELVAEDGSRIPLQDELQVGRSTDCAISIDDGRVSRKHAVLRVQGETVTVEDLGSANGTRVNGLKTSGVVTLTDGDTLNFDKHRYLVAIRGAAELDATIVADADATIVAAPEADTQRTGSSVASDSSAAPDPAAAPSLESLDLPGSWVNAGTGESTRVLSMDDLADKGRAASIGRASDLPHLVVLDAQGHSGGALELQTGSEQDVWEIGREPPSEIVLNEPSVSERHAQLIHQDGRWRVVNLVSTNGIFVNGEQCLTAYLSDGDEIRLGAVTLVFHVALASVVPPPSAKAATVEKKSQIGLTASLIFFGLVLLLGWWLL